MKITAEEWTDGSGFEFECNDCGNEFAEEDVVWMVENRDGEETALCSRCAAIYMAETLDGYEYEFINRLD